MGTRSEKLATRFETALADLVKEVEQCTDDQWRSLCGDERWTVAATARHVGAQWPLELEYITASAEGRELPSYSWDEINEKNAKHAETFRNCTKDDVISLLTSESPAVAAYVRGLSDEQLDHSGPLPLADGATVSTQDMIEGGILIDHAVAHTKSIGAARAQQAAR
jgi:hypothetical protein